MTLRKSVPHVIHPVTNVTSLLKTIHLFKLTYLSSLHLHFWTVLTGSMNPGQVRESQSLVPGPGRVRTAANRGSRPGGATKGSCKGKTISTCGGGWHRAGEGDKGKDTKVEGIVQVQENSKRAGEKDRW